MTFYDFDEGGGDRAPDGVSECMQINGAYDQHVSDNSELLVYPTADVAKYHEYMRWRDGDPNASPPTGGPWFERWLQEYGFQSLPNATQVERIASGLPSKLTTWDLPLYCATTYGVGRDNPTNPTDLTDLQRSRSVALTFVETSTCACTC